MGDFYAETEITEKSIGISISQNPCVWGFDFIFFSLISSCSLKQRAISYKVPPI